jgi:hypothetical protein
MYIYGNSPYASQVNKGVYLSFPRSAWECRLDARRWAEVQDAERPGPAFPRGAWEREECH